MREEEMGISIGEIFKVIFKRVWWVISVTAVVMLAFVLVIEFCYNRNKCTYDVGYSIEFPDNEKGLYPDGTAYRLADVISLNTLKEIKASNELFKSIDVDDMVSDDGVSISYANAADTATSSIKLSVKIKYFTDKQQATAFIRAVAEYPVNHAKNLVENAVYSANLNAFDHSRTYDGQIEYLKAQRDYIDQMYDSLILLYGQYYNAGDKTLLGYKLALNDVFSENDYIGLLNELNVSNYVKDVEWFKLNYKSGIDALSNEKQKNIKIIEALMEAKKGTTPTSSPVTAAIAEGGATGYEQDAEMIIKTVSSTAGDTFNNRIAELTERNVEIDLEIAKLESQAAHIESGDKTQQNNFEAKLARFRENLKSATDDYAQVKISVFDEKSATNFASNKLEPSGGINIILAAIIGAIIGFVAVSIVICIKDVPVYLKERDGNCVAESDGDKEKN